MPSRTSCTPRVPRSRACSATPARAGSSRSRSTPRSTCRAASSRRSSSATRCAAHVIPVPDHASDVDRLDRVALSAARILGQFVDSNQTIGVAWGSTMSAMSRHLVPKATHNTEIVQLNGAGNVRTTGILYASELLRRFGDAFGARVQQFPVPAFFDDPATKQAFWRERSTRRLLDLQARHRRRDLRRRLAVRRGAEPRLPGRLPRARRLRGAQPRRRRRRRRDRLLPGRRLTDGIAPERTCDRPRLRRAAPCAASHLRRLGPGEARRACAGRSPPGSSPTSSSTRARRGRSSTRDRIVTPTPPDPG